MCFLRSFKLLGPVMKIRLIVAASLALCLFLTNAPVASAASIKDGDACNPAGAIFKQGKVTFICKKMGGKIVWKGQTTLPIPKDSFKMPRVVGMNLQLAQDLLQSMGSYLMDQTDAAGLGRWQIIDSNWKVCRQSPAAGKIISQSITVTLASVKLAETCP